MAWEPAWKKRVEQLEDREHELQIHREALGFHRHRALEELYPIPPKRHRPDDAD